MRGGRGAKALLVRQPVQWTFTWVGLDRVRVADNPFLMAGVVPMVKPFGLSGAPYGLRSDSARRPGRVDLLADDAAETVRRFVVDDALPELSRWSEPFLAEVAEKDLAVSARAERASHFLQAAGWRVVNDTGSPIEPAEEAAAFYRHRYVPAEAAWFEALIAAWNDGERPAALAYLEEQKVAGLGRLKVS